MKKQTRYLTPSMPTVANCICFEEEIVHAWVVRRWKGNGWMTPLDISSITPRRLEEHSREDVHAL